MNPFERNVWEGGEAFDAQRDVGSLNAHAGERIREQTLQVAADHASRCMLLLGQPGLGKSHVLARAADRCLHEAYPVVLRDYSRPGSLFRTLFRRVTWSLLQPRREVPENLLKNLVSLTLGVIRKDPGDEASIPAFQEAFARARAGTGPRPDRRSFLEGCLRRFEDVARARLGAAHPLPLYSRDALRVLFFYYLVEMKPRASAWLQGHDVSEEDLEALGVQRSLDDEGTAREAMATLALLAALTRPLVICLDQTEQLESSPEESGIEAMARAITALRELPGLSLVFSCLKDRWNLGYARDLPSSYRDRITSGGNDVVELHYPTPEEGAEVVRRRLGGSLEPFDEDNLRTFVDRFGPSPRLLLQECARRWRAWQREGATGAVQLPLEGEVAPPASADRGQADRDAPAEWEDVLTRTPEPGGLEPATVEDALSRILTGLDLRVGGRAVTALERPRGSRIDLVLLAGARRFGFALDDLENGSKFARRLKGLQEELDAGAVDHLFFWRKEEPRASWRVGRERLSELAGRPNVSVARPQGETLRMLQAFRGFCARLQADGRDHQGPARRLLDETLSQLPELAEVLAVLGASGEAPREAVGPAEPGPAANVREAVTRVMTERKILHRDQLLRRVERILDEAVDQVVLERVLDDLEGGGVLWRLDTARENYVVASR